MDHRTRSITHVTSLANPHSDIDEERFYRPRPLNLGFTVVFILANRAEIVERVRNGAVRRADVYPVLEGADEVD